MPAARGLGHGVAARFAVVALLGVAFAVSSANIAPERAAAECSTEICRVSPDGKGIIGLGLLGAELGFFLPAVVQNAAHTNEWWPYLVFPAIGVAGGVVGGYFLEQETRNQPEIAVSLMVVGMVLIVPTVVGTLAFAAYTPPAETIASDEDLELDDTDDGVEAIQDSTTTEAAPDTSPQSSREVRSSDPFAGGMGLIRFDATGQRVIVGVPIVSAMPTYTAEEVARLHLTQTYDVHVPVVSATF